MRPLDIIVERLRAIADGFVVLLPQMAVALIVTLITWALAKVLSFVYRRAMARSSLRRSLVDVLQRLISISIWLTGLLVAATIMLPGLTPSELIAGLGIGSLAIGLAFKDIFENFLAGILILLREPMRLGDFVEVEGVDGHVVRITIRDTYIRRTDGQLVLVPNAMLFKNPVYVLTDQTLRRATVICGIAYGEDVDAARGVIEDAVKSVDSVDRSKPVQIFAQAFGESSIDFEVTWWTGSKPVEIRRSRDQVVAAVKRALDEAGIEIPFPYRTLTFKEALPIVGQPTRADDGKTVRSRPESQRIRRWPRAAAREPTAPFNENEGEESPTMASEILHAPRERLSKETLTLHHAIVSLMEELEAVDWYRQRADDCEDEALKEILLHNMREEMEHAAMVIEWIRRNNEDFEMQLRAFLFKDDEIADH